MTSRSSISFSADDDNFHEFDDHPWFTETSWFSFNIPERKMGGWLHGSVRPNLGICTSYVFVWDDTASSPWEIPYYVAQYSQPLPSERDFREFTFPHGWSLKVVEPTRKYQVSYSDRDLMALNFTFEGITEPHPFVSGTPPFQQANHFDQPGRITGELVLHGEKMTIDCYSVRDRSWGPRIDHRGGRIGYPFATASRDAGFCVFVRPQEQYDDGSEVVNHGYLIRDGVRKRIESGCRRVERDPAEGWIKMQILECKDEVGRTLRAEGKSVSRMILPVGPGICVNTLVDWEFDGVQGWGEDQDVWRYDQWSAARRAGFTGFKP